MLDRRARLAGIRCIETALAKHASEGGIISPSLASLQGQKTRELGKTPTAVESVPKVITPPTS